MEKKFKTSLGRELDLCSCPTPITIYRDGVKQTFGCGKCPWCLSKLRNVWNFRLNVHRSNSDMSFFLTLTYSSDNVSDYFNKKAIQKYHKRLRKYLRKFGFQMSYYLISEYGSRTYRPHLHELVFLNNVSSEPPYLAAMSEFALLSSLDDALTNLWPFGYHLISPVTSARINYITHYHIRPKFPMPDKKGFKKPFVLCSRGLGVFNPEHVVFTPDGLPIVYDYFNGLWIVVPSYYRRKFSIELPSQPDLANASQLHSHSELKYMIINRRKFNINYNTETF